MCGREEFEWWMSDEGANPAAIERNGGGYKLMQTQQAWIAWIAAYSLGLAKGRKEGMEGIVWLARNYAATLSGRVVRDADECLDAAQQFIRQAAQGGGKSE